MERGESRAPEKRCRRRYVVLGVAAALLLLTGALALALGLALRRNRADPKPASANRADPNPADNTKLFKEFMSRCKKFGGGYDCDKVWGAFEQAYVGRDHCKVPVEAYDPLIAAAPLKPSCNRLMFWSKTKEVVHKFTEKKKDCFLTVEDTLLGSVMDGLTWCGKEGSSETFTTGCPDWNDCDNYNNPVRSFWNRVSAAFADDACGDVTAMLSGSIDTPFDPTSVFASIEVKRLASPKVKKLTVVLVTQKNNVASCSNKSLKDLQKELDKDIKYNCKEVPEAQLEKCGSKPDKSCSACW